MSKVCSPKWTKTPRVVQSEADSRLGSYPTISRVGDADRTGRFKVKFDDRSTIMFVSETNVQYPTGLFVDDAVYVTGTDELRRIAVPPGDGWRSGGGIEVKISGTVRKGVADITLRDIPNSILNSGSSEAYRPFVEDGLYAIASASWDDPFYLTGTHVSILGDRFDSRLVDKTKITIDITPSVATTFGYTQAPVPANPGDESPAVLAAYWPMVYYNFVARKWEKIGIGPQTSLFTSSADIQTWLEQSPIGFGKGMQFSVDRPDVQCLPISNFGFPLHAKFHATASQLLDMSQYIDKPFLFEKYVIETDMSYSVAADYYGHHDALYYRVSTTVAAACDIHASMQTFFILNQRSPFEAAISQNSNYTRLDAGTSIPFATTLTSTIPTKLQLEMYGSPTAVSSSRDLVTFGQILSYFSGAASSGSVLPTTQNKTLETIMTGGLAREHNIDLSVENATFTPMNMASQFSRRKIIMSGTVKQAERQDYNFGWCVTQQEHSVYKRFRFTGQNVPGGRTSVEMSPARRELNAQFPAGRSGKSLCDTREGKYTFDQPMKSTIKSPYILLPSDRLVLGWQVPMHHDAAETLSGTDIANVSGGIEGATVSIYPTRSRLVLYGSLIKDGHEYHETLNQPLASNAIHEPIGNCIHTLDQFDVPHPSEFAGTSFATSSNRFSRATTLGERFYDTLVPNLNTFAVSSSVSYTDPSIEGHLIVEVKKEWPGAYPFEPRYGNPIRVVEPFFADHNKKFGVWVKFPVANNAGYPVTSQGVDSENEVLTGEAEALGNPNNDYSGKSAIISDVKMHMFGFGDNAFDSAGIGVSTTSIAVTSSVTNRPEYKSRHMLTAITENFVGGTGAIIRGWKYGILNVFSQSSTAIWRHNSYGQHRDMLEQRLDTKFFGNNTFIGEETKIAAALSSPIIIQFVSGSKVVKGNTTWSSNLDVNATSSLPYFDGVVRNRENPLNESLIPGA